MPKQSNLPFFKSYPDHWLFDDKASALSLKAFGAWFKIVNRMWIAGDGSGVLEGNVRGLRRLLGAESDNEMNAIIDEMIEFGVGNIEKDGDSVRFYSPRVEKEWNEAKGKKVRRREYDEARRSEPSEPEPEPTEHPKRKPNLQMGRPMNGQYEGADPVELFKHYTGYSPPLAHVDQIKHRCKNLKMWDATVQAWMAEGYKKTNVINMIEKYESDVAPKATKTIGDKAPSWRIEEERNRSSKRKKACVICGATDPSVGGITGDERCGKISCQAVPPKYRGK